LRAKDIYTKVIIRKYKYRNRKANIETEKQKEAITTMVDKGTLTDVDFGSEKKMILTY